MGDPPPRSEATPPLEQTQQQLQQQQRQGDGPLALDDLPFVCLARVLSFLTEFHRVQLIGRVSRKWDALLLRELGFGGAPAHARVPAAALAALCRRAGAGGARLRRLDVSALPCCRLHASDLLAALSSSLASAELLEELIAISPEDDWAVPTFSPEELEALRSACARLRRADCVVRVGTWEWGRVPSALRVLPGRFKVICRGDVRSGSLGAAGAEAVALTLREQPQLTALDFSDQRILSQGLDALSAAFAEAAAAPPRGAGGGALGAPPGLRPRLPAPAAAGDGDGEGGEQQPPQQPLPQRVLHALNLSGNNLGSGGAQAAEYVPSIVRFLWALPKEHLASLDLTGTGFTGRALAERDLRALRFPALRRLALGKCPLHPPSLAAALASLGGGAFPALTSLDVHACGLRLPAAARLARAAAAVPLRSLDLHDNLLSPSGGGGGGGGGGSVREFAEALAGVPTLEVAVLGACSLGSEAAAAVARELGRGCARLALRQLDLSSNGIGGAAAAEIVQSVVAGCPALEALELHFNALRAEERAAVRGQAAALLLPLPPPPPWPSGTAAAGSQRRQEEGGAAAVPAQRRRRPVELTV